MRQKRTLHLCLRSLRRSVACFSVVNACFSVVNACCVDDLRRKPVVNGKVVYSGVPCRLIVLSVCCSESVSDHVAAELQTDLV